MNKIRITRDEKDDELSTVNIDLWIFRLFLLALTFIPLIIGAKAIQFVSPLVSGSGITETSYQLDSFTYFKFIFLIIVTIVTLSLFLYKIFFLNYKFSFNKISITILVFIIFLTFSVIFAEYKSIALWGLYNRHDGAITFIAYAILMIVALNINYPKYALNKLVYTLYPFVWINVVISVMNLYEINILQNSTFQKIFTLFLIDEMSINESSILTGTLNQWNYMSGYSAVMTIIFLSMAVFHGSIKFRVLNLTTAVAAFLTILSSISTNGYITVLLMLLLVVTMIFIKKNKEKSIVWFASFIIITSISTGILAKQNPKVWDESVGFFIKNNPFAHSGEVIQQFQLIDNNKVSAADPKLELPKLTERYYSAGSGRIYIWENVIKLINEKPITGYGLDTLTYHFPQGDINKRSGMYDENTLIDKPHNLYLGILYGTGLLGFISFIYIVLNYSFRLLKYVINDKSSPIIWAFSLGWVAFLIQAIFNDSVIGATIVPLLATSIIYAISNSKVEEEIS